MNYWFANFRFFFGQEHAEKHIIPKIGKNKIHVKYMLAFKKTCQKQAKFLGPFIVISCPKGSEHTMQAQLI